MYTICSQFAICSFARRHTYIPLEQVLESGTSDGMDYAKRFAISIVRAVWGPAAWYGWIWRAALAIALIPASRDTVRPVLQYLGLEWVPSSWFVIAALVILAVGLAAQCASWMTSRVIYGPLRSHYETADGAPVVRINIEVSNASPKSAQCRAVLNVYELGGTEVGSQVALTTQRRLQDSGPRYIGRFNLDDHPKEIRICSIWKNGKTFSKSKVLSIEHQQGQEALALGSYRFEIAVIGAGKAARKTLSLLGTAESIYISDDRHGVEILPG